MARQVGSWIAVALALSGTVSLSAETQNSSLRELQLLRKRIIEQEQQAQTVAPTNAALTSPTFATVEKLYLDGKISARQFQQYIRHYNLTPGKPAPEEPPKPAVQETVKPTGKPAPNEAAAAGSPLAPGPAPTAAGPTNEVAAPPGGAPGEAPAADPALNRLAEMEAKMDRILQQKAELDKARTNKPPSAAEPKTKRERLDALLRELISGSITEAEYKTQWAKIVAEKED